MSIEELRKLRDDTDTVLRGLSPKRVKGAINWGSLSCLLAREWRDCEGGTGLTVIIEEASPEGADELHAAVQNGLDRMGYHQPIEVVTEW